MRKAFFFSAIYSLIFSVVLLAWAWNIRYHYWLGITAIDVEFSLHQLIICVFISGLFFRKRPFSLKNAMMCLFYSFCITVFIWATNYPLRRDLVSDYLLKGLGIFYIEVPHLVSIFISVKLTEYWFTIQEKKIRLKSDYLTWIIPCFAFAMTFLMIHTWFKESNLNIFSALLSSAKNLTYLLVNGHFRTG